MAMIPCGRFGKKRICHARVRVAPALVNGKVVYRERGGKVRPTVSPWGVSEHEGLVGHSDPALAYQIRRKNKRQLND